MMWEARARVCLTALNCLATMAGAGAAETIVATGSFHGGPHAPADTASGAASIVRLDNGQYELRFGDDFTTTAGPDLFVYLSAAKNPKTDKAIAKSAFIDAGKLQAIAGAQSYRLPAGYDAKRLNSVAVWCKQYRVLFGAAPLSPH